MAQSTDLASEEVVAVNFGLMTSEEVKKLSVVNVHNPTLMASDTRPMPGGLYDPLMGPLNEGSVCKSCGQRYQSCPGHCGHINLVAPAYNPLLFNMLYTILNNTCLFCLHFRASNVEVNKCVNQLKLIAKGDIVGAEKLEGSSLEDLSSPDDSDGSHVSYSTLHSIPEDDLEHNVAPFWDSLRFTEAMAILKKFMGKKRDSCTRENCGAKNPSITKPTFGWFNMAGLTDSKATHNAMHGVRLFGGYCRRTAEKSSSEVINTDEDTDRAINLETEELVEAAPQEINMRKTRPILPFEVRDVLQQLWENETPLCSLICNIQQNQVSRSDKTAGYFMFFLDTVLVPPIRFRPEAKGGDSTMAHAHTTLLGKVIECNIAVRNARINKVEGSKIVNRWMELQQSINLLYYGKTGKGQRDAAAGICQLLEKKEGIFRQKMMGKRVNYACRSVISPDPYLAVNEIGVPPYFALRLSYPERVTPWNVAKLREAVINGPESHPGALKYSDKGFGLKRLPVERKARIAISRKLPSSSGVATQSGKNSGFEFEGKIVYRHLQDGDIVLVNRQPTLHKPSIMAHVVRVLKGEKTLRMHYANCSTYNADFDGDEMNVHFPQDEISRAEAYNIVNANEQYIVPTKGDTVRGLIQDHIVGAVLLTMKNRFLTREEFSQLLYSSGVFAAGLGSVVGRPSRKVSLVELEGLMQPILPAVWKPVPLWTGKQVISALLNHLTRGQAPCTVEGRAKIPYPYFPSGTGIYQLSDEEDKNAENKFLVYKNELVHGVIDKAQFGKFGLVHTVQELYGSNAAGILLSSLSRLFTIFLQMHGFTCGVDDLIILPHYDIQRKEELEGEDGGEEVHCEFVKYRKGQIGPKELQMEIEKAICSDRDSATASLDMKMKNKLSKKGSQISKELLTKGLLKPFPWNCISLMTISGAKGSTVNFQQISSYLGQQELEGKRVPRMVSGKSLPCFPPWDFTSRAGGYITDRFLSGLRPQEYYFHCMAGREGLVDTAVKTSRSGYLQRCLVKNLESLKVCYDYTVRDSDGSIVQFYYGDDGVDVHRTSFLKNFKALAYNQETICQKYVHQLEFNTYIQQLPVGLRSIAEKFIKTCDIKDQAELFKLVEQKYISSLAPSGEPVGVLAAQSVGEPSTQMTLNTFHLAGRGEMNVTLGIPRLQEILMTAGDNIKTPILTCPFKQWRPKDYAKSLVAEVKKVSIADLVENMEVRLLPLSIKDNQSSRIYKLMIKIKENEYVSLEDCQETLRYVYLRELEDAIEAHLVLLSKINGIKNYKSNSGAVTSNDEEDNASATKPRDDDDGEDEDIDDGIDEDIGSDARKHVRQANDEIDYEDSADEGTDRDASAERDTDNDELGTGVDGDEKFEGEEEISELEANDATESKPKSIKRGKSQRVTDEDGEAKGKEIKKAKSTTKKKRQERSLPAKKSDRHFFVEVKGLHFEVHFRFTNEPHVLLAQIAQKASKNVFIKSSGKIDNCRMVGYDASENTVVWDEVKTKRDASIQHSQTDKDEEGLGYWALKATGTDFASFWRMQDDLDVTRLYSNNVRAMLRTYGVEAARASLIREVKHVFGIYGVEIDYRHLSLIADYMTHSGGYRSMSRHGSIAESLSPFIKMSFETASKFIIEAASHGLTDTLDTPSSRICLGLPVKSGTGSFDLMQKLDI